MTAEPTGFGDARHASPRLRNQVADGRASGIRRKCPEPLGGLPRPRFTFGGGPAAARRTHQLTGIPKRRGVEMK
ncbi:hypothetical protein [Actinomadura mexicana]|uniref:Uncharacterized protein n=1 Tax=Actinomadura mexicana TaxID=134959 RepID=A0A238UT06_9ACTN|nr:hypothetical protein [Actinomadura mexicana]SNR24543.1 hypothetical protein SAMN06265355_101313 [Actinomadura mexicana]